MDHLRQWAVLACTAALVCSLLYRLFGDHPIGKQGRMLLPCLFLCTVLTPLAGMDWSWVTTANEQIEVRENGAALTARMRQQTVEQVEGALLKMVNQPLMNYGMEAQKVLADMDIREDGSISMGQITVYVDATTAQRSAMVKQIVEKRLGMPVTVAQWEVHGE